MNRVRAGKALLAMSVLGGVALVAVLVAGNPGWRPSLDKIHRFQCYCRMTWIGMSLGVFVALTSAASVGLLRRDPRRTVAIWCLVIGLLVGLFPQGLLFLWYGYGADWQVQGVAARARSDLRSIATALEAYMLHTKQYPAWTLDPKRQVSFLHKGSGIPTFLADKPGSMMPSSTFRELSNGLPIDPFGGSARGADGKRLYSSYAYWVVEDKGWVLWSPGPDEVFDLDFEAVKMVYDPNRTNPTLELIVGYTYDPTNGTISAGDIWRVLQ